ncbi:hypothetical protein RO03_04445 [Fusobacterium nucleatum subsp. nucleatum]|uniref:DUF3592 domain-containing protein n=1 Tax=Fusobacterium nucleatum subsp. nucleatum TaxID=76856 RepID=A0A0X3Y197_FUSNC|nr:DUF3592 domain-containing protein [Fusobacterium nucleatum]KUL98790.1 hypothetical protein RO03_04445 [Fusobacterium nucleatum subsp. nucleatum]
MGVIKMSNRLGILLSAGIVFIFASVFLIIAEISKRISESKIENFQGEAEGEVLEVIKSGRDGVGGKLLDTFVVYQYEVNKHKYIVKPYVLSKNAAINQKYFDSEIVTCITYMGTHGMSRQTKYRAGESITIKYNLENPKKHEILNDKDKMFAYKGFKIAGSIIMIIPIILVIVSFFV